MSKRKYNEIKNAPIDVIFEIENAVDIYLLKNISENFKCEIRKKLKELPKKDINEINKTNKIINNKKQEYYLNIFNSLDFSPHDNDLLLTGASNNSVTLYSI